MNNIDSTGIEYPYIRYFDKPVLIAILAITAQGGLHVLNYLCNNKHIAKSISPKVVKILFISLSILFILIAVAVKLVGLHSFFTTKNKLNLTQDTSEEEIKKVRKKTLVTILCISGLLVSLHIIRLTVKVLENDNKNTKIALGFFFAILVLGLFTSLIADIIETYNRVKNDYTYREKIGHPSSQKRCCSNKYKIISWTLLITMTLTVHECLEDTAGFSFGNGSIAMTTFISMMVLSMLLSATSNTITAVQYCKDINLKHARLEKKGIDISSCKVNKKLNYYMAFSLVTGAMLCFALCGVMDFIYKENNIIPGLHGWYRDVVYIVLLFLIISFSILLEEYIFTKFRNTVDNLVELDTKNTCHLDNQENTELPDHVSCKELEKSTVSSKTPQLEQQNSSDLIVVTENTAGLVTSKSFH